MGNHQQNQIKAVPEANIIKFSKQYQRHIKIISIVLFVFSLLLLIALISYSSQDEINASLTLKEVFGLIRGSDAMAQKVVNTQNWLSIFGAIISHITYNYTLGYIAFFFPFVLALWAKSLYQRCSISDYLLNKTIVYLVFCLFFASFTGTLAKSEWFGVIPKEWSGAVGLFVASFVTSLIGNIGAFIVFFTALAITVIMGANVNLEWFENKFKQFSEHLKEQKRIRKENALLIKEQEEKQKAAQQQAKDAEVNKAAATVQGSGTETQSVQSPITDDNSSNDDIDPARIIRKNMDYEVSSPLPLSFLGEQSIKTNIDVNKFPEKIKGEKFPVIQEPKLEIKVVKKQEIIEDIPAEDDNEEIIKKPLELTINKKDDFDENDLEAKALAEKIENLRREHENKISKNNIDSNYFISDNKKSAFEDLDENENEEIEDKEIIDDEIEVDDLNEEESENVFAEKIIEAPRRIKVTVKPIKSDAPSLFSDSNASISKEKIDYVFPTIDLLNQKEDEIIINEEELKMNARILQEKLETFKIFIENLTITPGPVVTQYEFVPAAGIKISKIESLSDDIAMALKAKGIRIIAPVPGKGTVGIEIPNHRPSVVSFKSVINTPKFTNNNFKLPLAFGKTISGEVYTADLAKMPHLLIAGSTGSGKSVGINTIITSLLYRMHPKDLKFIIIDPKKVELRQYEMLSNHFLASSPDLDDMIITDPQDAVVVLKAVCAEMDKRYDILAEAGQRNIYDYNQKVKDKSLMVGDVNEFQELPFIVVIVDELADLMLTASKEVESPIIRIAQLGRAAGIHCVIATQRPSVDVITGIIKANFPARVAYLVASRVDSRTILDSMGAEKLLGNGDMLFLAGGHPKPIRVQNAFVSTEEVEKICEFIGEQKGYSQPYLLPSLNEGGPKNVGISKEDRDPFFEEAARLVIRHQQGSVSLIQRRLKVGYARAGRIVDELEAAGVVGPYDGSKARQVYMESESDLEAVL